MSELNPGFEAHAFNPVLGSEVAAGNIFLDRWAFRFQSDTVTLEIPLPRLEVELGEGEDERIFFRDSAQPDWKIYTSDYSILDHHSLAQANHIREQLSTVATRRELSSRLKITLGFLAVCVVIAWLGWLATGVMVRSLVAKIPSEWEQEFGDSLIETLQEEETFLDDSNQVARVAALASPLMRVVPAGKTGFTFHIIEGDEPNAMALPGGHVIVNTGLLKLVDRPEELLGAIAHETAHVAEKHGFRKAISQAGPFLIFGVFLRGGGGLMGVLSDSSEVLVSQSFSQEYETEADDVGWKYLVAANIDPRGMTDLLFKLRAYEASDKSARVMPQAFSSHPALEKRIARLEAKWRKLPRKTGFIEFKADERQPP